jgi:hypothetical protein
LSATRRPTLSVVLPARGGLEEVDPVLQALLPEAEACGAEVVVVGGVGAGERAPNECVRLVAVPFADICELHKRGVEEARGEVVAIGEDHAIPRAGWCENVLRAHVENGDVAAVVGCLANATDATVAGRANFLAFAAAWQPPMAELPSGRPPPVSTLSFKREALEGIAYRPSGWLEADLIPALFADGSMVADDRVVVDHHQDHGSLWAIRNAFHSARASYGYWRRQLAPARRREVARWTIANVPRRLRAEAREGLGATGTGRLEWALIWLIATAAGLGAATGSLAGPGRSPELVA